MNAVRNAIETLYKGICTVQIWMEVEDPVTHVCSFQKVPLLTNQKCKLSFEKQMTTTNTVGPAVIAQTTKLFIAPELDIPAGSKITVTQEGRTLDYVRSGEPAIYSNHQEILLEPFKRYA